MDAAVGAVLFDMDGLLVDTEPTWTVAEIELAVRLGGRWTSEIKAEIVGTRLDVAVPAMLAYFGVTVTPASVAETLAWLLTRMRQLYAQEVVLLPGAAELLAVLRAQAVPVALVSSSYRLLVDAVLGHGLGPFDVTVAGDEVPAGKPAPDPYLQACAQLDVHPRRCVVLEDSPSGVVSGLAAGCAVLAVPSVAGVVFAPGTVVRSSLVGLTVADLAGLLPVAGCG